VKEAFSSEEYTGEGDGRRITMEVEGMQLVSMFVLALIKAMVLGALMGKVRAD